MIDAAAAATSAVACITPALVEIAKGGAARVGEVAIDPVLAWMRRKLAGPGHEALTDLEQQPNEPDNQAVLRKQLAKLLQQNPALLDELVTLLPKTPAGDNMTVNVQGAGAKGLAFKGDGNTVSM